MTAAPKLRFSFREYLSVDELSEVKHEYFDGLILAMAGGTPEHARIAAAVGAALARQLEGKRCAVFSEALRIRVLVTGFAGYPDVSVICGALERDPENANTVTNPAVVVEVLSPSTEEYDRGEKLKQYRQIPALRHVVLVAHDTPRIEVWSRTGDDWQMHAFGPGERAALITIDCVLNVDQVFADPLAR